MHTHTPYVIEREEGLEIYLYSDVSEQACHGMPPLQVSIDRTLYGTSSYGLVQPSILDNNLTKTKCSAIKQGIKQ